MTSDHINSTPYSVMRVRLAAQVLSETVGNVLNHFGLPEVDKFVDCLNVRRRGAVVKRVEHISTIVLVNI